MCNARNVGAVIRDLWDNLDQSTIGKLILSMPHRVEAVINNRGGITRYYPYFG
jgi:hypothetical protein